MSSDNASSAVTYTSVSSDLNEPSWGIPLVNAGELPEIDPYEEVAQQGQEPPLSPAYVPDPMELDEHVLLYVLEPKHLEYNVPSDDDIQDDSIDYPDEPEDDDEDPEEDDDEDPEEDDDEDPEEDPSQEHDPEDDDEDPEKDPSKEHDYEDDDEDPEEDPYGRFYPGTH
ncbi:hypothetical protein Tco_1083473 [Tanacetum coccineum]